MKMFGSIEDDGGNLTTELQFLDWAEHRLVWIDDEHIDACIESVQNGAADGIAISAGMGYRHLNIDFLHSYPNVKGVVLPDASRIDLSALKGLRHLEFLSVAGNSQPIDLSLYPSLRQAWLEWHDGVRFPERGGAIRMLALHRFRPKSGDLTDLPVLPLLGDLSLINSSIESVEGLGKQTGLMRCEMSFCAKVGAIKGLLPLANQLRSLECQRCPCLRDYESIGQMHSLEVLRLNSCATIPTLKFVTTMKALKELRFVGTDVMDGDMNPLITHSALKSVAFTDKRHFSHRVRYVQSELEQSLNERRSAP